MQAKLECGPYTIFCLHIACFETIADGEIITPLSARLCNGNAEFFKHDEENVPPSESMWLKRQELY